MDIFLSRSDPAELQPLAGLLACGLVSRSLAEPTFDTSSTLVQLVQSRNLSHRSDGTSGWLFWVIFRDNCSIPFHSGSLPPRSGFSITQLYPKSNLFVCGFDCLLLMQCVPRTDPDGPGEKGLLPVPALPAVLP